MQPQWTTGTSVGFPSDPVVDNQKFFFHSRLVIVSTEKLGGMSVSVLVTSNSSHDMMPVINDGSVEGIAGLLTSVLAGTETGMVTGPGTGIMNKLPFGAVEVLCNVLNDAITVATTLVFVLVPGREDGVVDIKGWVASPVPDPGHEIPDAFAEVLAIGL